MTREEAIKQLTSLRIHSQGRRLDRDIEALDMAIKALEQTRWVPVTERLPEDGQNVIFCDIEGDIMLGYHNCGTKMMEEENNAD